MQMQPPTNSQQSEPKTSSMVPLVATVVLRNTTELAQSPHHPVVLVQELIRLPDEQVINRMIFKMESHTGVFQPWRPGLQSVCWTSSRLGRSLARLSLGAPPLLCLVVSHECQ